MSSHSLRLGWNVRPAEPRDAARISEIYNEGIEDGQATLEIHPRTPADILAKMNASGHHLVVAEWGGKPGGQAASGAARSPAQTSAAQTILGWASITPYSTRECYAGVGEASVYISRGARHQGLGRLLLDALVAVAVARGYHKLIGRLLASNTASRQLVRGLGFREVGVHQKHGKLAGQWVDVVVAERLVEENLT
jgi:L-amino acid N-acyltransferase YncA